jgi:hypothetical protein
MNDLLIFCIITSLKITTIHVACWTGYILHGVRNSIAEILYTVKMRWLEKPLYDCLPCMASFWGFFFWWIDGGNYNLVDVVLITCGINCLIERVVFEKPKMES